MNFLNYELSYPHIVLIYRNIQMYLKTKMWKIIIHIQGNQDFYSSSEGQRNPLTPLYDADICRYMSGVFLKWVGNKLARWFRESPAAFIHHQVVIRLSHLPREILGGSSQAKEKVLLPGPNNYKSAITDQTLFPWPCLQLEEQHRPSFLFLLAEKTPLSAASWRLHRIWDSFSIKWMTLRRPGATLLWLFGLGAAESHRD